jgi:hypothetical protein
VGSLILQFIVNPAGQVSQVGEITARLNDPGEQTVAVETGRWASPGNRTLDGAASCSSLEGMDITTLVRWESVNGAPQAQLRCRPKRPVEPPVQPPPPPPQTSSGAAESRCNTVKTEAKSRSNTPRCCWNLIPPGLTTFTIGTKVRW